MAMSIQHPDSDSDADSDSDSEDRSIKESVNLNRKDMASARQETRDADATAVPGRLDFWIAGFPVLLAPRAQILGAVKALPAGLYNYISAECGIQCPKRVQDAPHELQSPA